MQLTTIHTRTTRLAAAALVGALAALGGQATPASAAPTASGGNVWDRVAACESGGRWNIATGNGYYGGLQFSASSWRAAGGARYASLPHRATKAQQIAVAQNLLRKQGPRAWPHCGPKAGLTRSNGGAATASRGNHRASVSTPMTRTQIRALQRKVGARVDGLMGAETVRKTEAALGLKRTGSSTLSAAAYRGALRLIG